MFCVQFLMDTHMLSHASLNPHREKRIQNLVILNSDFQDEVQFQKHPLQRANENPWRQPVCYLCQASEHTTSRLYFHLAENSLKYSKWTNITVFNVILRVNDHCCSAFACNSCLCCGKSRCLMPKTDSNHPPGIIIMKNIKTNSPLMTQVAQAALPLLLMHCF